MVPVRAGITIEIERDGVWESVATVLAFNDFGEPMVAGEIKLVPAERWVNAEHPGAKWRIDMDADPMVEILDIAATALVQARTSFERYLNDVRTVW